MHFISGIKDLFVFQSAHKKIYTPKISFLHDNKENNLVISISNSKHDIFVSATCELTNKKKKYPVIRYETKKGLDYIPSDTNPISISIDHMSLICDADLTNLNTANKDTLAKEIFRKYLNQVEGNNDIIPVLVRKKLDESKEQDNPDDSYYYDCKSIHFRTTIEHLLKHMSNMSKKTNFIPEISFWHNNNHDTVHMSIKNEMGICSIGSQNLTKKIRDMVRYTTIVTNFGYLKMRL